MPRVTGEMVISDVLLSTPGASGVFDRLGLGCPSCFAASMETLAAVASMHEVPLDVLLAELNAVYGEPELREHA